MRFVFAFLFCFCFFVFAFLFLLFCFCFFVLLFVVVTFMNRGTLCCQCSNFYRIDGARLHRTGTGKHLHLGSYQTTKLANWCPFSQMSTFQNKLSIFRHLVFKLSSEPIKKVHFSILIGRFHTNCDKSFHLEPCVAHAFYQSLRVYPPSPHPPACGFDCGLQSVPRVRPGFQSWSW